MSSDSGTWIYLNSMIEGFLRVVEDGQETHHRPEKANF